MTYFTERQRRIEDLLRAEFEAAGIMVFQIKGDWFANLPEDERGSAAGAVNLTKLAERIDDGLRR